MLKRYYQDLLAKANPIRIALLLPVLAWLFLRRGILFVVRVSAEWLYRFELLVFPPAAFASNFYVLSRFFPTHLGVLIGAGALTLICQVMFCASVVNGIVNPTPVPTIDYAAVSTQAIETVIASYTQTALAWTPVPPTSLPTETAIPFDPQSQLRVDIEKALGFGNRDVPRLIQLNFDNPEAGAIYVNWAINDNLTEDLIVFGAKSDATDILKVIAKSGIQYTYVLLSGSFPMADAFGNSEEKNVVNLTFYKATVDKINWDGFLSDNIYAIADEAHVWVQFQK